MFKSSKAGSISNSEQNRTEARGTDRTPIRGDPDVNLFIHCEQARWAYNECHSLKPKSSFVIHVKTTCLLIVLLSAAAVSSTADDRPSKRIEYAITYVPFLRAVLMYGGWAPPNWVPTNEVGRQDLVAPGGERRAHLCPSHDGLRRKEERAGRLRSLDCARRRGLSDLGVYDGKKWDRKADFPVGVTHRAIPNLPTTAGETGLCCTRL